MRIDGIELREGSQISNLTVASGSDFPAQPNTGEMFYRTSTNVSIQGLYVYISGWTRISTETQLVAPNGSTFPGTPVEATLFYYLSGDANQGLYYYDTTQGWILVSAPIGTQTSLINGDITGTITDGRPSTLTLPNISAAGTYTQVTTNAKGQFVSGMSPTTRAGYGITDAQPLSSELTALASQSNGIPVRTGTGTWSTTSIAGTSGRTTVTNGTGVAGNPTIDLATVTQTGTPSFVKVVADTYGRVTGTATVTASDITPLTDSRYLQANQTISLTGDVTGSGATGITTTLATVNSAPGSKGSASAVPVFNVTAKGLVTAEVDTPIAIDASQTITGAFANARISQGSVTQYQSNLTILESQITDGALLARNAGNESITGTWTFSNPLGGATPVAGTDLTTKNYVDSAIAGLSWKNSVKAASTANMTLSGVQTVDGISLVGGDRILVKNQTTASQNGIYVVNASNWARSVDSTTASQLDGEAVYVLQGTTQADTGWTETATVTTVGTDSVVYSQFSGTGAYQAGTGLSLTGNTFANTGVTALNLGSTNLTKTATAGPVTIDLNTTLTGLTSVSSTNFVGALTGASSLNILKAGDTMTGTLTITNPSAASNIAVNANASGTGAYLSFDSGLLQRWVMGKSASPESGSNVGSDFFIQRYTDAGALIDLPLGINRATGLTTLGSLSVTGASTLSSLTVTGTLTGHASLDLPLTGGTLTGALTGTTITATTFSGALTGHASLDLPLTGGIMSGLIQNTATENYRLVNDAGYISFYNTANSQRTGYIQGNTNGNLIIASESANAGAITMATGGVTRILVSATGMISLITGSSSAAGQSAWNGNVTVFGPNAASTTGAAFGIGYNTSSGASELMSLQPGNSWKPMNFWGNGFTWYNAATAMMSLGTGGLLTATSFTGAGTGLTGTAASLSIGGNAATATSATSATTAGSATTATTATNQSGGTVAATTITASSTIVATGNITTSGEVVASGTGGFASSTYATNVRNPIWRFGNADAYGLSYFQGTSGLGGSNDSLGFHFGTATAAGSILNISTTAVTSTVPFVGSFSGNATTATTATNATLAANTSSIAGAVGGSYTWTGGYNYFTSPSNCTVGQASQASGLMAYSNGGAAAMSFHRPGVYAINFGMDTDNVMRLGGWSDGANVYRWTSDASGNMVARGEVTAFSDIRVKKDIETIPNALDKVEQLRGVTYTRTDTHNEGKRQTGVIAQEVQAVLPEVVHEDREGMLSVAYGNMVGLLIESIKELSAQNKELKARLDALENK